MYNGVGSRTTHQTGEEGVHGARHDRNTTQQ